MAKTKDVGKNASAGLKRTISKTVKTKRGSHMLWTEDCLRSALKAVQTGAMSQRKASQLFKVPRSTLQDYQSGKAAIGCKPGRKPVLPAEVENRLADYASNRASMGYGFGKQQFIMYAGALATKYGKKFRNNVPCQQWWYRFSKRHGRLRLRQPEGTSTVRHNCMEPIKIVKYFVSLEEELTKLNVLNKPELIWNMDETGLSLEHKPRKVVAAKGIKHLQSSTSGNREQITVIATINAAGHCIPPHIITKGKTQRSLESFQTDAAPIGTTFSVSDSDWTKQSIAALWFLKSFLANIGPERPQVLKYYNICIPTKYIINTLYTYILYLTFFGLIIVAIFI